MMDNVLANVSNVKCVLCMILKKRHFIQSRVKLLGNYVDKGGVHVDEVKVENIRTYSERSFGLFLLLRRITADTVESRRSIKVKENLLFEEDRTRSEINFSCFPTLPEK